MNQKLLFTLWGGMFILCAGLGFIPEPEDALSSLLTAASILFFLPPALLLYHAAQSGDSATGKLVRNLAALSLSLTLVLLVANFASSMASDFLGTVLYYILVIVSSPMVCSGHWAMSLFCWACVLMASRKMLKQK